MSQDNMQAQKGSAKIKLMDALNAIIQENPERFTNAAKELAIWSIHDMVTDLFASAKKNERLANGLLSVDQVIRLNNLEAAHSFLDEDVKINFEKSPESRVPGMETY